MEEEMLLAGERQPTNPFRFGGSPFWWSSITTKKKRQIEIAHVELFQSHRWQAFSAVWIVHASLKRGLN
jgi:hypothetical protein